MTRLAELPLGKSNQLLTQLGVAGVSAEMVEEALQRPSVISGWAADLLRRLMVAGFVPPLEEVTSSQARKIMKDNFHGVSRSRELLDASLPQEGVRYMSRIPFSRQKLEACRQTHILVAILPATIRGMRIPTPRSEVNDSWAQTARFMDNLTRLNWWLIQKTPLSGSLDRELNDQIGLMAKDQREVPPGVLLQAIWRHECDSEERLFSDCWVRAGQVGSWTDHPIVSSQAGWLKPVIAPAYPGKAPWLGLAVAENPDLPYEPFRESWQSKS